MRLNIILLALLIILLSFANSYSQSWTDCSTGIFGGMYGVECIANKDSIMFAAPSCQGIFRSSDKGVNWFLTNSSVIFYVKKQVS